MRDRFFNYIVLNHKGTTVINKRVGKDIWTSLYDFPLIESTKELKEEQFLNSKEWKSFIGKSKYSVRSISESHKHILSHQKIYARFFEIDLANPVKSLVPKSATVIKTKEIRKYAVPRLIENYLDKRG